MSAWRIGKEAGAPGIQMGAGEPPWKAYVERLTKYIPGDAIAGYTAVVSLFTLPDGKTLQPQLWLAIAFVAVTEVLVLIGWASARPRRAFSDILPDLFLALVAFVLWSATVPGNGWTTLGIAWNVSAAIGVIAGLLLPGLAKIMGR